jgi:hypothetical protein
LNKFLWISAKRSIARPQIIMLLLMRTVCSKDKETETVVNNLRSLWQVSKRFLMLLVVAVVTAAFSNIILFPGFASAGQVSSRSITLSSSLPSATSVTYTVSFKPTTSTSVGGIVVDFCSDTPLIGSTTCAYPAGFTMGATPSVTVTSGIGVGGTWLTTNSLQGGAAAGQTQTLLYTNTTAQAVTGGTPIIFTINNVTNTSTAGTFYARILTFDTSGHTTAQYTAAGTTRASSFANMLDYGGIALSTVAVLTLNAKVFESLTFCVYAGASCGSPPVLTLGDPTTGALASGSTYATSDTALNANSASYNLATNAANGVNVVMTGTTLCRAGGSCATGASAFTINSMGSYCVINSGTCTPNTIAGVFTPVTGSEQFGMCADVTNFANVQAGTSYADTSANNCHAQTVTSNIYSGATSKFGFNDSASAGGTNNAGGSTVLTQSSPGAVVLNTGVFWFIADISVNTEAGAYTTGLDYIATSTF